MPSQFQFRVLPRQFSGLELLSPMHQVVTEHKPSECLCLTLFFFRTSLRTRKPRFQSNTKNPLASRRELSYKTPKRHNTLISMSVSEGSGVPNPPIPLGLNLEQAREIGRGNVIHQLQQNYQALFAEVTQMSNELREVLAHLRSDPGVGLSNRSGWVGFAFRSKLNGLETP